MVVLSCQKGEMLMLLYTDTPAATFGHTDTNNAHSSNNKGVRLVHRDGWLTLLLQIRVVPCSNIGPDIGYTD
jgi:hypothetical protein